MSADESQDPRHIEIEIETAPRQQEYFRFARIRQSRPALSLVVLNGSGPSFADALRTERRASTAAVVGRLLLRLAKEERRGHHPDHC